MEYRKQLGDHGEVFAMNLLEDLGYEILTTKFRSRMGEIDIIARKNGVYHFVEVKTRNGPAYGHPAESVDRNKRQRMVRTAEFYLMRYHIDQAAMQFDVIEIEVNMLMACM